MKRGCGNFSFLTDGKERVMMIMMVVTDDFD